MRRSRERRASVLVEPLGGSIQQPECNYSLATKWYPPPLHNLWANRGQYQQVNLHPDTAGVATARLVVAKLAACKTLVSSETPSSCLSIVPFARGPKRSMGHVLGAEKN